MPEIDYEKLAMHVAGFMSPDALLDADGVGALIGYSGRSVRDWWSKAPNFPKAVQLAGPGKSKSHPRWVRKDITAWVASHQAKKAGRPRKEPE